MLEINHNLSVVWKENTETKKMNQKMMGSLLRASVEQVVLPSVRMVCNNTCCTSSQNVTECYSDRNFSDTTNITSLQPWRQGMCWTYAILVCAVAMLGNLSIITILLKNRLLLRTSVNIFILNMAVADLLTALAGPIPFTIKHVNYFYVLGEVWCHLEGYIQIMVMLVSVTSLAVISFDRMIGVVRPFHQHLKKWQGLVIIITIWVVGALLAVPWYIYRVFTVHEWQDVTETLCKETRRDMLVWWKVIIIGLTWLPLLVMVCCYTTISCYFKYRGFPAKYRQAEHPGMTHMKRRVMRMMFVMVMLFAVCWMPFQVLMLSGLVDENGVYTSDKAKKVYEVLLPVSQYMIYTNAAVNPLVYALMHQTFRRAFRVTFSCLFTRKSHLVLTRGQGLHNYVWSVRSTVRNAYGQDVLHSDDDCGGRARPALTPSALLGSSVIAASIALEPQAGRSQSSSKKKKNLKRKLSKGRSLTDSNVDNKTRTKEKQEPKVKIRSRSAGNVVLGESEEEGDKEGEQGVRQLRESLETYVNEGFVSDLPQRRIPISSTGALGHLITEVIQEESSSDVESERIL